MLQRKVYKYRIYPNEAQREFLARQFGATRYVYNCFLDLRIKTYEETGKGLSYNQTAGMLTELKKELVWLREPYSQVLQAALADLDSAYTNFFAGRTKFPKFKSKYSKQSCRYAQGLKFSGTQVYLPKLGWVDAVFHRSLNGEVRNATVSKTKSGKYFISISVIEDIIPIEPRGKSVGIDLGIKSFATLSSGVTIDNPEYLRNSERKLRKLERRLSRKKKGSARRKKARIKLARHHEKIRNKRKDFQHKLSNSIIRGYDFIAIEDLNIAGMIKNHSLAKSIADASWAEFVGMLEYKGDHYGSEVVKINRFLPSSKRHFACGWVNDDLKLSDRVWVCKSCGEEVDRDANAAQNILNYATAGVVES